MTTQKSHGKAQTRMPRSARLKASETVPKPSEGRGADGRFGPGNRSGVGARAKHAIAKTLGADGSERAVAIVASDAKKIFGGAMRVMPTDAAPVRSLVALHARHVALHGYFTVQAERVGLATPEGMRLLEVADRQSARAERVLVTALDVARVVAEQENRGPVFDPSKFQIQPRAAQVDDEDDGAIDEESDEPADDSEQTEPDDEPTINPVYREPRTVPTASEVDPRALAARQMGVDLSPMPKGLADAQREERERQERLFAERRRRPT